MVLRFVVDVHTTCFGLHGHLQVCKIFSFLLLKESASLLLLPLLHVILCSYYIMQQLNLKRYWTIQCNRMLKYNIMNVWDILCVKGGRDLVEFEDLGVNLVWCDVKCTFSYWKSFLSENRHLFKIHILSTISSVHRNSFFRYCVLCVILSTLKNYTSNFCVSFFFLSPKAREGKWLLVYFDNSVYE
jgi:hypothetical protein